MHRPICALLLAVSLGGIAVACGTIEDESGPCMEGDSSCGRPLDLEYITAAILAPSCGQTQCHSKFHRAAKLVFDNPDDARTSLHARGTKLLQFDSEYYDPADGPRNLIQWVTEIDPFGKGIGRMPFDAPLPDRDIRLMEYWIRAPFTRSDGTVEEGGTAAGAQCDPNAFNGEACNFLDKVKCNPDGNFGEPIERCKECRYRAIDHVTQLDCVVE